MEINEDKIEKIKNVNENIAGITLIALVVTIIVLIILVGVSINLVLVNNGILKRSEESVSEYNKQSAAEKMNLKITNIQMESYAENEQLPTLQYLADALCEDDEMQYVLLESQATASLDKIVVGDKTSIFTKLKEYPYEFEINSSLQLASIDGVEVATNDENYISREEYNSLLARIEDLESNNNEIGKTYNVTFSDVSVTANTSNTVATITLPAGKYVLVGFASYRGNDLRYHISLGGASSSAYDKNGYVAMNVTSIVTNQGEQSYNLIIYPTEKSVTISNGWIKAIKIANY